MGPEHTNDSFEAAVSKLEAVIDADHVTGRFDYQLRVACHDTAELDRLLRQLKTRAGRGGDRDARRAAQRDRARRRLAARLTSQTGHGREPIPWRNAHCTAQRQDR